MDLQMSKSKYEAPRTQGGASRARSGEQEASKGNFILIVPPDPAYLPTGRQARRGLRGTCRSNEFQNLNVKKINFEI
jgi:hypothetical protein